MIVRMMFTLASSSSAVSSLGGFGSASSAATSSFPSESTVVLASSPSCNRKESNVELEKKNLLHFDRFRNYYSLHLSCRSVVPIFVIICFHVRRASKAAKVTLLLCIKWNAHLGHIVLKGSPVTLGEVGLVTACKTIASSKRRWTSWCTWTQ